VKRKRKEEGVIENKKRRRKRVKSKRKLGDEEKLGISWR